MRVCLSPDGDKDQRNGASMVLGSEFAVSEATAVVAACKLAALKGGRRSGTSAIGSSSSVAATAASGVGLVSPPRI